MNFKVSRGQIAVGQGSFSFGHIKKEDGQVNRDFLYIHDCGGLTNLIDDALTPEGSLPGNDIDIMFMSHFDNDHFCGLQSLIKKRTIRAAHIPKLSKNMRMWMILSSLANGEKDAPFLSFLQSPKDWFIANGIPVVELSNDDDAPSDPYIIDFDGDRSVVTTQRLSNKIRISSKSRSGTTVIFWELNTFVQFGEDTEFISKLATAFKKIKMKTEEDAWNWVVKQKKSKLIKDFYVSNYGEHNAVSLCLFSAPIVSSIQNHIWIRGTREKHWHPEPSPVSTGWLYTADYPFRDDSSSEKFYRYFELDLAKTALLVVPHHGSDLDFKELLYRSLPQIRHAVVPVGCMGQYGHPGGNLLQYLARRRISTELVMDDKKDTFITTDFFDI